MVHGLQRDGLEQLVWADVAILQEAVGQGDALQPSARNAMDAWLAVVAGAEDGQTVVEAIKGGDGSHHADARCSSGHDSVSQLVDDSISEAATQAVANFVNSNSARLLHLHNTGAVSAKMENVT